MAHIFENSHTDKTPFCETNRLSYDDILKQRDLLIGQSAFKALSESLEFPVLILNEHKQVVFLNTAALDCVHEHDHPDHVLGFRFGEFLGCNHMFNGKGCEDPSTCANCNELPAILSALDGRIAEAEGVLTLFENNAENGMDYKVSCHPFIFNEEAYALVKLIPLSA